MNYTVNGKNYTADDGYVFCNKNTGGIYKKLRLTSDDSINNYDVKPISEPEPETTELSEPEETLSEPEETLSEDKMTAEDAVNKLLEVINNV